MVNTGLSQRVTWRKSNYDRIISRDLTTLYLRIRFSIHCPTVPCVDKLADFFRTHQRIFVITGAGISTGSGIPDYRNANGEWKRKSPITHQEFTTDIRARKRYWSRSMIGWKTIHKAAPNSAHIALQQLEEMGFLQVTITQNVDRLHQRAGSRHVVDLHGRIDQCVCLICRKPLSRNEMQVRLEKLNPAFANLSATSAPDGDADLNLTDLAGFIVPECRCGGNLMPDVVFYGGSVPKERVNYIQGELDKADGVLVVGSSLMVYSSFRFCKEAAAQGKAIVAINQGLTRADDLLRWKIDDDCTRVLPEVVHQMRS